MVVHEVTDHMTRALAPRQLAQAAQVRDGEEIRKPRAPVRVAQPGLHVAGDIPRQRGVTEREARLARARKLPASIRLPRAWP
jgi:hypothetical protein